MKGISRLPLEYDIVHGILVSSPDFVTLGNMILIAKVFHDVFRLYPTSTLGAGAYNVVGPALPKALRDPDLDEPETDWTGADEYTPIEPGGIPELVEIATTAKGLEDLFSLRHKNHKCKESQLTFEESLRFQRAMYQITLYSRIFDGYQYLEDYRADPYGDWYTVADVERQKRRRFLDTLSGDHLLQIHSVSEFLIETALIFEPRRSTNGLADRTDNFGQMMLSAGPDIIYQCYDESSTSSAELFIEYWNDDDDDGFLPVFARYFSEPLFKLYRERKMETPSLGFLRWKAILDSTEGQNDKCLCGLFPPSHQSDDLFFGARPVMSYLYTLLAATDAMKAYDFRSKLLSRFNSFNIINHLKGHLHQNPIEAAYFWSTMDEIPSQLNVYEYIVQDILDGDYKQTEFKDWKKDDWICTDCLTKVLEENLHLWLLNQKNQAGYSVPTENCPDGWGCRAQTRNQQHAAELNHICPPTKTA
ncbi:hypothetical protein AAF712_011101 [Marasmius tenuissimus]|uniref:Uncharacterized protein n=1 Tax=Marasmius tenuissimus TaxID=585030 RepID=A0ABR2ZKZ7_9AGAR